MALKAALDIIGNTPLVSLKRLPGDSTSQLLAKLETNNPSGSFKDRVVKYMMDSASSLNECVS
jgi:cysteine synthase B